MTEIVGPCPKCNSADRRRRDENGGAYGMNKLPLGTGAKATVSMDNVVCVTCGYVEFFIGDTRALEKIKKDWDPLS
jgi:hypothetical protein